MRSVFRILLLLGLSLLLVSVLCAQQKSVSFRSFIIDDFDDPEKELKWIVRGSRAIAEGFPHIGYVESWPEALHGFNREKKKLKVLGVEAAFTQRGYNYLEIIPAKKADGGKLVPSTYGLPLTTRSIDMWIWGLNYHYTVEVHVRDPRGLVHVLYVGKTDFYGWKNMSAIIPGAIRRINMRDLLNTKGLELMKIVIWTRPMETSRNFFIYFDDIKAVTDGYKPVIDGGELADPDIRKDLWDQATQ